MWGHRVRRTNQSIKKPIESLLIILRPFLNALMLAESITCYGKLFHRSMTRSEKKKRLKSNEQWFFRTLAEWPLVLLTWLSLKYRQNGVSDSPFTYGKLPANQHDVVFLQVSINLTAQVEYDMAAASFQEPSVWICVVHAPTRVYPSRSGVPKQSCNPSQPDNVIST